MPLNIGNFLSDAGNAAAGVYAGKSEADDKRKLEELRQRQMAMQESETADNKTFRQNQLTNAQSQLTLSGKEFEAQQARDAVEARRVTLLEGDDKRKAEESLGSRKALRARMQQRGMGDVPEGMSEQAMEKQLQEEEDHRNRLSEISAQGNARISEIKAQHTYDLSRQQTLLRGQVQDAQNAVNQLYRAQQDGRKAIENDPMLMGQLLRLPFAEKEAKVRELVNQRFGRDIFREHEIASQQLQQNRQRYQSLGVGGSSPSPLADAATDDNLAFSARSPEQQAKIAADLVVRAQKGQPLNADKLSGIGAPVSDILRQSGFDVDPKSGMAMKAAAPVQAPGPIKPQQPLSAAEMGGTAGNYGVLSGPTGAVTGAAGQQPPAMPASLPAPQSFTAEPPSGAYPPSGSVNGPASAAPQPVKTSAPYQPPEQAPALPSPGFSASIQRQTQSPADAARAQLSQAASLPDAERSARFLLNSGDSYDNVINSAPPQMRSMLAAKLPKRIPTQPLPGIAQPPAPLQQQMAAPNPFTTSKPLFSPPGV